MQIIKIGQINPLGPSGTTCYNNGLCEGLGLSSV